MVDPAGSCSLAGKIGVPGPPVHAQTKPASANPREVVRHACVRHKPAGRGPSVITGRATQRPRSRLDPVRAGQRAASPLGELVGDPSVSAGAGLGVTARGAVYAHDFPTSSVAPPTRRSSRPRSNRPHRAGPAGRILEVVVASEERESPRAVEGEHRRLVGVHVYDQFVVSIVMLSAPLTIVS